MRDPERIDRIIGKLRTLWHNHPDLRLGQLVENLLCTDAGGVFYAEDTVAERRIDQVLKDRSWVGEPAGACSECDRIAEDDGDILPPACEKHGGKP